MEKRQKEEVLEEGTPQRPSFSDLRGRQSVRATFKLSERAIDALSLVSLQLGIKQKSLFDHLIEDIESLTHIAREIRSRKFDLPDRVQKTYVLSRKTLSSLENVSKSFNTPRDALVEYSVKRLLPIIAQEKEKQKKRRAFLRILAGYLAEGNRILEDARDALGAEDPVYERMKAAMEELENAGEFVDAFVKRGKILESY